MTTLTFLQSFATSNGLGPLTIDGAGDLYSYTSVVDTHGNTGGDIVELTPTAGGYSVPVAVFAYSGAFSASNVQPGPYGFPVLVDSAHNIYFDYTGYLPNNDFGEVYKVEYSGSAYGGTARTLASFDGTDGSVPYSALISDGSGGVFGTTSGGTENIFHIAADGSLQILPSLSELLSPSGLFMDSAGDLIGTSTYGPLDPSAPVGMRAGYGAVFEVQKTMSGYANTVTLLATFDNDDSGANPLNIAGVVADSAGNLFGQTSAGGFTGYGEIYEIPKLMSGGYGALEVLADNGVLTSGGGPLIVDAAGNLFGYSTNFITNPAGTVFELAKNGNGYSSRPTILENFSGAAATVVAGLVADGSGNLFGIATSGGANGAGALFELSGTPFVTCFASGTLIATPCGARAVETLVSGDSVVTASGQTRRVRWTGRRRISCAALPEHRPVRVRAHAFGPSLPRRDLFLSPDHAVFVDGVLIPVRYLIEGHAIGPVSPKMVVYHHVELDSHDILLAEGLPAESYLDRDDRQTFDGPVMRLRPAFGGGDNCLAWEAAGCAPLVIAGPALERVRARLTGWKGPSGRASAGRPRRKSATRSGLGLSP